METYEAPRVDRMDAPLSLVERLFPHPDNVCQGEYYAIYDLLLNMDERADPEAIAGVLREFAGWATYMLVQMKAAGLIGESELTTEFSSNDC